MRAQSSSILSSVSASRQLCGNNALPFAHFNIDLHQGVEKDAGLFVPGAKFLASGIAVPIVPNYGDRQNRPKYVLLVCDAHARERQDEKSVDILPWIGIQRT